MAHYRLEGAEETLQSRPPGYVDEACDGFPELFSLRSGDWSNRFDLRFLWSKYCTKIYEIDLK